MRTRGTFILAIMTILAAARPASPATSLTAALFIDGVSGPGIDGAITATSFQFLPPDGREVRFAKALDAASPQLQELVVKGTNVPVVKMVVTWPGRRGAVTYTMTDVVFSSFQVSSDTETDTFHWTAMTQAQSRGSASVAGQAVDLCSGRPVGAASVTLGSADIEDVGTVTDARGHFKLTGLADGEYDLVVTAPGYLDVTRPVLVAGGKGPAAIAVGLTPLVSSDGCG